MQRIHQNKIVKQNRKQQKVAMQFSNPKTFNNSELSILSNIHRKANIKGLTAENEFTVLRKASKLKEQKKILRDKVISKHDFLISIHDIYDLLFRALLSTIDNHHQNIPKNKLSYSDENFERQDMLLWNAFFIIEIIFSEAKFNSA
jgi:hypothetical protein